MIYVALLRGINVGGKTKIEMPRLKRVFETLGCKDVLTYINSGNVLFSDDRSAKTLKPLIGKDILKEFGIEVPVVLRDKPNIQKICKATPASWTNDLKQKTDVLFLWDEIDKPSIVQDVMHNPEIENIRYIAGALLWNIGREHVTRGGAIKLIKTDLYKSMTVRNINTVRKLGVLMDTLGS